MPFAAAWMGLEIVILSKVSLDRGREIDIAYKQNLKSGTNELIYKTEADLQTYRMNLRLRREMCSGVGGKGLVESLGWICTHCYI